MPPIILLAGGAGLVGSRLAELLVRQGYAVRILTRKPRADHHFGWDVEQGRLDERALDGVHAIVNLAGEGIADGRWTSARRRRILQSRVGSAALIREALERREQRPAVYLASSAIGYYGNSGERLMRETDAPAGGGFLVDVCQAWEKASETLAGLGLRTAVFRTGIVLAREGGALPELLKPVRFGLAGYFGDGRAWYSWIHRDDLCRAFIWAIENPDVQGVFNAVAPAPVRNKTLVQAAARALGRPALAAPVPAFGLRLAFGEMADTILHSNRISAEKISQAGFQFQFPDLDRALKDILTKGKDSPELQSIG